MTQTYEFPIELRWVVRTVPRPTAGLAPFDVPPMMQIRVLQIRHDISATQGVWFVDRDARMSAWQDVPTILLEDQGESPSKIG